MKHSSPKDIFLQLFATAMLYLSIIGTFAVSFNLTDWFIKSDTDSYPTTIEQLGNMMSFPLAMLVVAFPLFVWGTYMLYKRMKSNPKLQKSQARSWLTNLTLFLAAIIIAVTAIIVVYSFFDGDLTARTLVKSAIVVLISILTIYWYKGGEDKAHIDGVQKVVGGVGLVVFIAIVILGIVAMGSPKERRMMREDRDTLNNVQNAYYTLESSLYDVTEETMFPETLSTNTDVTYTRLTDTSAELCATFRTEYNADDEYYSQRPMMPTKLGRAGERSITMPDWSHGTGNVCYTVTLE